MARLPFIVCVFLIKILLCKKTYPRCFAFHGQNALEAKSPLDVLADRHLHVDPRKTYAMIVGD